MIKLGPIPVLITSFNAMVANGTQANAPYVADYLDDKRGALSFTLDGGFDHQVENTRAIIEPLGIHGTFCLIPHMISEGPNRRDNMNLSQNTSTPRSLFAEKLSVCPISQKP